MKPFALVTLLLALAGIAACGESSEDTAAEKRYRKAVAQYRSNLKDWKADQVAYDECVKSLDRFRSQIKALDGRLGVGLSFDEYGTKVGDVAAAYNQTDFEAGGVDCLTEVVLPLETAVNQYKKAYDIWQKCFEDYACENDSITPELQDHWSKATLQIQKSDFGLEGLTVGARPPPPRKPEALQ